jgi:flagellin
MISLLTNVTSLQAQQNLSMTQGALSNSIEQLSSGLRINSAADDAAGLGVSESLQSQINSYGQATQNANDAVSLSQVAEGGMGQMQTIVSNMKQLAVESSNSTLDSTDRSYIQTEFTQLSSEINRIAATTNFNGQNLLDGSASSGLTFQVGIYNSANDRLSLSIGKLSTSTLGSTSLHLASISLSTATNAQAALNVFDTAIAQLSTARANIGSMQTRMQDAISNLNTTTTDLTAANSQLSDVDVASTTAKMTQQNILEQAGIAVLGQANQLPNNALSLIQKATQ